MQIRFSFNGSLCVYVAAQVHSMLIMLYAMALGFVETFLSLMGRGVLEENEEEVKLRTLGWT